MALNSNKFAAASAVAAAFSLLATPVAGAELPRPATLEAFDGDALNVQDHRRWRRDRNDIDAGDVIAGVLVLGAIAAVAGAAKDRRDRDDRYRYPYPDGDAGYRSSEEGRFESRGMDRAVDQCVAEVERGGTRVETVDTATRDVNGWYVSGATEGGSAYSCRIDNSGRVSEIGGAGVGYGDPVYDDEYYADARGAEDGYDDGYDNGYDDERYEDPDFNR